MLYTSSMEPNKVDNITLRDGRTTEYAEYGDSEGENMIFFHGFIGSHNQASPAHEAAQRHGLRMIAPNRAGVGHSSPNETRTIIDRMDDVRQLVDDLDIAEFNVMGVSGGAPYALATAHDLRERVKSVTIVSGMGTVADRELLNRMESTRRRMLQLAQCPLLADMVLAYRMREYKTDPRAFLRKLVKTWPEADQKLFEDPSLQGMFLRDLENVLAIGSGTKGLSKELKRYFRWGFDPSTISQKVHFWHGTEDTVVPPVTSEYMAERLPDTEVSLLSGGHSVIVEIVDDVIEKMQASLKDTNS